MASSPIRRLCHWGPIAVLGIIKLITWAMVHHMGMWWPPTESRGGAVHAAVFLLFATSTMYYFLQSLLEGPGFVPLGWKPEKEEDTQCLQFCHVCEGYKAPRSHHCRQCGRCVLKLDHHCPWINCCVGHHNHPYFVKFLFVAVLGCFQASIVLSICIYHAIHRVWYIRHGTGREPMIYMTLTTLLLTLLSIGMAIGVVLAVGALLYFQIRSILRNQTTIEDWIMEKAACRHQEQGLPPFVFPYDLGKKKNFRMVFFSRQDGLRWPVREGCGEYDLTLEQICQKQDKRLRSRVYSAVSEYSGRWVPLLSAPRAALAAPCTDEPRLPLAAGDSVRATRQRKHWLFGEKIIGSGESRGPRGWFPRYCVVPAQLPNVASQHRNFLPTSHQNAARETKHKPD
ncbi:palmitoyltransferase ZDHHC6-like [Plodia interpunctella]|uniref:palmitoyltransferase ZDHHC6-like n=1 Tax=Plodia interpunctella TaxID=58824 RepID=UPI0023689193|nr:palmitoyltransferase ZDHHC6-like [Plodia interpunctella]